MLLGISAYSSKGTVNCLKWPAAVQPHGSRGNEYLYLQAVITAAAHSPL